jgi:hypothetical protein
MYRSLRTCVASFVLLCLSPLAFAHSYSHISGNDWVITCNDGTEINVTGTETHVYNSVRSACRNHAVTPGANHNSVRSNKSNIAKPAGDVVGSGDADTNAGSAPSRKTP